MDIARVFKWWHGIIRHRYFEFKIYASIVTDAFCGLHNDKYTKYSPHKNWHLLRIACLVVEFGGIENLLDVLTQYEILGFCRLGLN